MGCCSAFSATNAMTQPDSSRHVNFTTGMVLGVDDYRQQFAYHAARDKWMMRELHGYGTLSGLAIRQEMDGTEGPRIMVTAGAAAAPSGQMICVGREQCASINAWLQREEVTADIDALAAAPLPANQAEFSIFLTLCYRDCAVAPVPIPGEPCRSDEELMTPSRIADDYSLSFSLERPAMTEAEAVGELAAYIASIAVEEGGEDDPAALPALFDNVQRQMRMLFLLEVDEDTEGELSPISVAPNLANDIYNEINKIWITVVRPHVMVINCPTGGGPGDDCVLLARLDVGAERAAGIWQVANTEDEVGIRLSIDESDRPLIMASNAMQAIGDFAPATPEDADSAAVIFVTADAEIDVSNAIIVIATSDPVRLSIVEAATATRGHRLVIRLPEGGDLRIGADSATIGGNANLEVTDTARLTLRSDGAGDWRVTQRVERGEG